MLRLFVHVKDGYMKVRELFPHEALKAPVTWGELEFEYTPLGKFMMAWPSFIPDLQSHYARAVVELVGARYPVSPRYQELKKRCPPLAFDDGAQEWVFYGGSFNPWHMGHQSCIELLAADKTCFILPDINPQKSQREYELVSSILELAARARFGDHQYLVPTFLVQGTKNPTVEWIERLHKEFPEKKLSLLIGFDSFSKITTWSKAKELLPLLHCLYVVSRMESEATREKAIINILSQSPSLKIEFLGRHDHEELSSTNLRRRL